MSFNYGKEKRKFEAEWRKAAAWYAHAGMDKASIEEIQRFDWELFCKERTYSNHTQTLPNEIMDESDERSSLFQKYENLSVVFSENDFHERTQREIAALFGISQVCVLKRIERVKKYFQ